MRLLYCMALLTLVGIRSGAEAAPLPQSPGVGAAPSNSDPITLATPVKEAESCLDGHGSLSARIRGALDRDLDWRARLSCDGEARPDGSGVRLSFAAPGTGHRLRLVFGISGVREGQAGKDLPTNLTVIEEGGRVFATQGDDHCTIDDLRQQREPSSTSAASGVGAGGGSAADARKAMPAAQGAGQSRRWRISARGFCTAPANALLGEGRILVSRFDFVGVIAYRGGS